MLDRSLRRSFLGLLLLSVLIGWAPQASAHARLESSVPSAGQTLETNPLRIELTFDEPISMSATGIKVFNSIQTRVDQRAPRISGRTAMIGLEPLSDGAYIVVWKAVSDDGHPISGSFTFRVRSGNQTALTSFGDNQLKSATASTFLRAVTRAIRFVLFAAVGLLIGASIWKLAGLNVPGKRWFFSAGCFGAIAAALLLVIDGPYVESRPLTAVSDLNLLNESLSRTTGRVLVALIPTCFFFGRRLGKRHLVDRVGLIVYVCVSSVLIGASGHGAAGRIVPIALAATALHVGAISTWVSGLIFLGLSSKQSRDGTFAVLWGRLASAAVAVIVVTGAFAGWRQVGSRAALTETTYGKILIAKLLIVALVLTFGALHRRQGAKRVSEVSSSEVTDSPIWKASTLRVEAMLGIMALAMAMALSAAVPARSAYSRPISLRVQTTSARSDLTIEPARVGKNLVHIYVFASNGLPQKIADAEFTFTHPATGTVLEVAPTNVGTGHREARGVDLPFPGNWNIEIRVYLTEFDVETGSVSFTVK